MTFKDYILHQLREIKREILVAISNLSLENLTSLEPCGHWPIAWIIQHCCAVTDFFIYKHINGKALLMHDTKRYTWPIENWPKADDVYPPLSELIERWTTLMDGCILSVEKIDENDICEKLINDYKESVAESCLRIINHTNAHLRAIWCILGEKRVDYKWPEQQTWLA